MDRNQKAKDEILEKIKNTKCQWPKCGKKQCMTISLPQLQLLEGGRLRVSEDIGLSVAACDEHMYWMMSGMFGVLTNDAEMNKCSLQGPFEVFEIAKIVVEQKMRDKKFFEGCLKFHKEVERIDKETDEILKKNKGKVE